MIRRGRTADALEWRDLCVEKEWTRRTRSFPNASANLAKPLRTPEPGHSLGVYASAAAGVMVKEDSSDASISNGKHAWWENAS